MNAAVRAVVRMGLYVGAKVYFIHEVSRPFHNLEQKHRPAPRIRAVTNYASLL